MKTLGKVLGTGPDPAALVARIVLGVVIFPHGAQKVLGWWGGHGLTGTMQFFTESLGIPAVFALLAIAAEFLGSLGLIVGLGTRIAALGIGSTMAVAAWMVHFQNGFFMNWSGSQTGEGFEYHLLAAGLAAVAIVRGGGTASIDGWIAGRIER